CRLVTAIPKGLPSPQTDRGHQNRQAASETPRIAVRSPDLETANSHRLPQLPDKGPAVLACLFRASLENGFDLLRAFHEVVVLLARRGQFFVDEFEQSLFGFAPSDAGGEFAAHFFDLGG